MSKVGFSAETSYQEWDRALQAMQRRIERNTYRAGNRSMLLIEREVKVYLRTYTHPPGTPTPSPPGGPPALVTGHLRRSWRTVPARPGRKPFTVETEGGPTAVYARIQELGGRTGRGHRSRLPRRPYVRPRVRAVRREVRRIHIDQWTQAIRGV